MSSGANTATTPSTGTNPLSETVENVPYDDGIGIQEKPPLAAATHAKRPHRPSMAHKRRRTSLLGNLTAQGRLSRGLSLARITFHLSHAQREHRDGQAPPGEDYYFTQDHHESEVIYLEKSVDLPGAMPPSLVTIQDLVADMNQPEPTSPIVPPDTTPPISPRSPPPPPVQEMEPEEAPPDAVFPVQRNTIEMQSKLMVVRNLRTYQQHNKILEGKCYYGEDEIDLTFLKAKPIGFLILGKPGVGRTTLGMKLAEKLHSVHLNPENIIEYFRGPREPIQTSRVNELLDSGQSIPDNVVVELIEKRITAFDVLHRGYVLEGFPLVTSDDLPVESQIDSLGKLPIPPEYLIIMHMQDKDLYKRRIKQKFDPVTGRVYTNVQYSNHDPDWVIFDRHFTKPGMGLGGQKNSYDKERRDMSMSDNPVTEEASDTDKRTFAAGSDQRAATPEEISNIHELDFPKMPNEVVERLFYRTEDFNLIVNDDLESFRFNYADLQYYVQNFDKRKVLEVDAYWSPTIIFRRVWEWCEAIGLQPVPVPFQIMRPMAMSYMKDMEGGEDDDEDDDDEDDDDDDVDNEGNEEEEGDENNRSKNETATDAICDDSPSDIDWVSAQRAVCIRGLVDPRFRWRISKWDNLCPVALKLGRSIPGKPELAVSFLDKVFFMSSKHAADQFVNNPRPYLLPKMPTSPIKFVILGHPLAGKTTFAKELAGLTDGTVIEVTREVTRRFASVKRDYLWKKRLKYSLEASNLVNRENELRWQRQERTRRKDMHAWVENYLKAIAEAEIMAMLERNRDELRRIRKELRKQSEYHAIGEVYTGDGACRGDVGKPVFDWQKFAREAFEGRRHWTHQELLELAWDLLEKKRLYYKQKKRETFLKVADELSSSETDEEFGMTSDKSPTESSENVSENEDDDADSNALSEDETDYSESVRRKKKKKKKKCIPALEVESVKAEDIVEPFLFEKFDVDPDDPEVEESVRMRFPMIPFELVDIVPAPTLVGDQDPVVMSIVEERLKNDEIYVDQIPPEIFVEILRRAVTEIEVRYRKKNKHGAMTGGWVIDDFPPDIEKWRAVLRTPQVCPDQAFLLLDLTQGNMTIWSRFKKLYKILHPPVPPPNTAGSKDDKSQRESGDSFPGEGSGTKVILEARPDAAEKFTPDTAIPGEDGVPDFNDRPQSRKSSRGRTPLDGTTTSDETEAEPNANQRSVDVDPSAVEIVSKSHFFLSLLPKDDLNDIPSVTSSEEAMIKIDLKRNQTQAFSNVVSADDMMGVEKYALETLQPIEEQNESKGDSDDEDGDEDESCSSYDQDEITRRRNKLLTLKPIYGEMSACLENLESDKLPAFQKVPLDAVEPESKKTMLNPPGTPETNDLVSQIEPADWLVPVPSEIEKGEVELTKEEEELQNNLVEEIKRLSKTLTEEYIKTPSEMASLTTLPPGSANSGEGVDRIMSNPLIQKLLTTRIESPKRKFFSQVRLFNEFWNMALPVSNQQGVAYWEVGLCDEETALEKAIYFYNVLESRFDSKAKKILETEIREEDEEILESLMKWGDPYEPGDPRYRSSDKDKNNEDEDSQLDSELDDDENSEDEGSEGSAMKRIEKDELAALENKPDLYWKASYRREAERCFGDFKYYCPVTYFDFHMLRKGFQKFACKYKDRLYLCADENSQLRFVTDPRQYLPKNGPPKPPPPRICITGSPGCLQEEIASKLCTEFKICYINFRQRLHEIIKARFGKFVGPEWTNRIINQKENEVTLANVKKEDDMLGTADVPDKTKVVPEDGNEEEEEEQEEEETEAEVEVQAVKFHMVAPTPSKKVQNIPSGEVRTDKSQHDIQDVTLKSLGLLSTNHIETIPLNSIERTEGLTERKWKTLTWTESYIKAFLENGVQLPDEVLDEFILPLWKAKPFTEVGFILVGFPNTQEDVQYMLRRNCVPEHVFLMECKSVTIRNRLIVPAVDRWHREKNPTGKTSRRMSMRTRRAKEALDDKKFAIGPIKVDKNEIFPYQTEGRPEVSEFESETWTYNDSVSREIARALRYYHDIYSRGIDKMKKTLNRERICWTPVDTNIGIHQGKHKVLDVATSMLKYRNNIFEDTVRLSFPAAQALLDRGVFTLSPLQRWCPVELAKGNTGINVWNAPGIKKIPYLHRRFIYFVAGEKNARHFEENAWDLINQALLLPCIPMVCMVLGKAKTGKTTLAKNIADRLGLLYVSCLAAVESVLAHAFVTEWATVLEEVNPKIMSSGHQPMHLACELLEYIRQGRAIPRYLVYRCLDLYLMNPKAQSNGVVFDDFPTIVDELIELNYREMTPCTVLHLKIPLTEAYERCDRERALELKPDTVPEESHDCIDYLWEQYGYITQETFRWFSEEYQNICKLDGCENPETVFRQASEICNKAQKRVQEYLENLYYGKPNTLDGTCPITSSLMNRLNQEYGFFCPVALNDANELVTVRSVTDLSQVVEYKGQIYLFSSRSAAQKFVRVPKRYTAPGCYKTPPKDLPQTLQVTTEDWERLRDNWGFLDFDPVLYYANHHYKGLQRGDPQYCVVYRRKLYVFINEENQKKFLKTPTKYWNLLLPMKIPRKTEPIDFDKITPYSYLSSKGMIAVLKKVLKLMAEKRPRGPFMNVDQCAALYMGYYLKSQNMNASYELRQKYRDAMFRMTTMKNSTKDFLNELQNYYGCRPRNLPDRLRKKLDEFVKFENLPIDEKVHLPKIPGVALGYEHVKAPFNETQVARKVRRIMGSMKEVELKEKTEAFGNFTKKKKAAAEAAERAAQDAKDAADQARKKLAKAQARMKKAKSIQDSSSDSAKSRISK